jgi:hypothetical protein
MIIFRNKNTLSGQNCQGVFPVERIKKSGQICLCPLSRRYSSCVIRLCSALFVFTCLLILRSTLLAAL